MIPNIRTIRKARGLSLSEMAERCDISIPHLSQIERGLRGPSPRLLELMTQALGTHTSELYNPLPRAKDVDQLDEDVLEVAALMQALPQEGREQMRQLVHSLTAASG